MESLENMLEDCLNHYKEGSLYPISKDIYQVDISEVTLWSLSISKTLE
jgi:hypothetical protein